MDDTRAIVTGHSRGLGEAVTAELLQRGIAVLGLSRKETAAPASGTLRQVAIDLSDPGALASLAGSQVLSSFLAGASRVLLVNNAGVIEPIGPVGSQGGEAIARAVSLNVAAPLALADLVVARADASSEKRILHISSGAGRSTYAGWSIYCATKAALDHHARATKDDAVPGLLISSLAPGIIDTDMQAEIRGSSAERFPSVERFKSFKAEGMLAEPAAVATRLVDFLLSDTFGSVPVRDLRET